MKISEETKDMRQLHRELGDQTKSHIEDNIVPMGFDDPDPAPSPTADPTAEHSPTDPDRTYTPDVIRDIIRATPEADFPELAKLYLGTKLKTAEGKPRLPQKTESLVIIADHFREILSAKGSGVARLNGQLHCYLTDHWKPLTEDESQSILGDFAQALGHRTSDSRHYRFREELRKQLESVSSPIIRPDDHTAVNFHNGTLHIMRDGENWKNHHKDDGMTYALPFDYDPKATCPAFDGYLDRVLPDAECQTVLMEFLGWIFLRDLKLEKMLVLYGSGHNGKSVLFDVMSSLLGEENISSMSLESLKAPEKRLPLVGKLLNYGSEISGCLQSEAFKKAASGEPLEFRRLYGDSFTTKDYARLAFNANNLPSEVEITDGFFRRFLIIPFDQVITMDERDPDLANKIISAELPGVMNRVLAGMNRLRTSRKFSPCQKADECLSAYQLESDTVAQFLDDGGWQADDTETRPKGEFYQDYRDYCTSSGFHALGIKNFASRLKTHHHIQEKKSGSVRSWLISPKENV
jgi:putative DNA primase/helicase